MDGHVHAVAQGAELLVEERVREDAVHLGADRGVDLELGGVRFGGATGQEHLAPGDPEGEGDRAGGRLPQPVAHLVVERLHLTGLDDVGVIAEPVEELGPVRLTVDGLELVAFDEGVLLTSLLDGVHVGAPCALPDAGHGSQRPEIGERIRVAVRLGEDVGAVEVVCRFDCQGLVPLVTFVHPWRAYRPSTFPPGASLRVAGEWER